MLEIFDNLVGEFSISKTEYLRLQNNSYKYSRLKMYIKETIKKESNINTDRLIKLIDLLDAEELKAEDMKNE